MKGLFLAVFLISLSTDVLAQAQQVEVANAASTSVDADKKFSVNASVDVGNNTKELLLTGGKGVTEIMEKLAKITGTTVEKVFPYYTRQAYYERFYSFLSAIIAFLIFGILAIIFLRRVMQESKARTARITAKVSVKGEEKREVIEEEESGLFITFWIFSVIFIVGAIIPLILMFASFPDWMSGIVNPEYQAIQRLVQDFQNLK